MGHLSLLNNFLITWNILYKTLRLYLCVRVSYMIYIIPCVVGKQSTIQEYIVQLIFAL